METAYMRSNKKLTISYVQTSFPDVKKGVYDWYTGIRPEDIVILNNNICLAVSKLVTFRSWCKCILQRLLQLNVLVVAVDFCRNS